MARIGRWLTAAGLFAASGVTAVTSAGAIDASGQWFLQSSFFPGPPFVENWTQIGTNLTTDAGWAGTINPTSGDFSLTRPSPPFPPCPNDTRTGTVAADALSFVATESDPATVMCHPFVFPITGSRYDCGNGTVDPGEQCDDGNNVSGDGCDAFCHIETCYVCSGQPSACSPAASGSSCDEGDPCTTNACDGNGACTEVRSCRNAGKSALLLETSVSRPEKDKLSWKWIKGAATAMSDLGVPTGTTNYALCMYAGTAVATVNLPAGSKWRAAGTSGFNYKDSTGSPNGAQKALLKSGGAGKAKALVKGKGANLPDDLVPMLPLPVTVQLVNGTNNVCFESVYNLSNVIKNDAKQFKAKTP
jgi:cysteine-rich repeat protein